MIKGVRHEWLVEEVIGTRESWPLVGANSSGISIHATGCLPESASTRPSSRRTLPGEEKVETEPSF